MPVTPANRDALRERAFAMSAQGIGVRGIARTLGINKETASKYVRQERQRRSHDRDAEDAVRDAVTSLRHVLTDLHRQYREIEGRGPHSMYARAKLAEAIRRSGRDLVALYGVTLPETDPDRIAADKLTEMMETDLPLPGGYPEVGPDAVLQRHVSEMDDFYASGWND